MPVPARFDEGEAVLKSLEVRNFTAFQEARLDFAEGLNVIIGENGTGKTHLLKLPYTAMAVNAEEGKKRNGRQPTKAFLRTRLAEKLINVFRPENRLGRLARRHKGRSRCEVDLRFSESGTSLAFNFASQNKSEVVIDRSPSAWCETAPVFLPAHDLLTIYPGFVPLYEAYHLEFDETWRDTCLLLGSPTLKGVHERKANHLKSPLEEQIGGRIVLERKDRFYLRPFGAGPSSDMEIALVAEGWRKIAMLARLIATGALPNKACLFWDEPESNLNPKLIREVAKAILTICRAGGQVIVATHSLFLLREFEVLLEDEFKGVEQRYFALRRGHEAVEISQTDEVGDVDPLILLDEELRQSERFIEEFSRDRSPRTVSAGDSIHASTWSAACSTVEGGV